MSSTSETVLRVHQSANGYWYIGAGRSIAEGPYRNPQQLLAVASDLLADSTKWRIEVFDVDGKRIFGYSSEQTDVRALAPQPGTAWSGVTLRSHH